MLYSAGLDAAWRLVCDTKQTHLLPSEYIPFSVFDTPLYKESVLLVLNGSSNSFLCPATSVKWGVSSRSVRNL